GEGDDVVAAVAVEVALQGDLVAEAERVVPLHPRAGEAEEPATFERVEGRPTRPRPSVLSFVRSHRRPPISLKSSDQALASDQGERTAIGGAARCRVRRCG